MCGRVMSGSWPSQPCQSLRHTPVASTRITAPSGAHCGRATSRTCGGVPNASITTARMVMSRAGSVADDAVDALADQVGVAVVPRVLLDHVQVDPAQIHVRLQPRVHEYLVEAAAGRDRVR